ncbi:hypothetical protein B0H14DRAFT_3906466 [Mycena olivaceomarginata]|nr:hypothetical protein B0H14DRAFT_3906466 [Mycena olivaceomarginata]
MACKPFGGRGRVMPPKSTPTPNTSYLARAHATFASQKCHSRQNSTLLPPNHHLRRPVKRVLHREHVASEHFPPEHQIIALTEFTPFTPSIYALHPYFTPTRHISDFPPDFYSTHTRHFETFLVHPYTPYQDDRPILAVYQHRTPFFLTVPLKTSWEDFMTMTVF